MHGKADDTALRYIGDLSLTPEIGAQIKDLVEQLRAQLKQLGESV